MALNYTNPGWTNDDEPYIDADNLNDISDNLEEATELIGNETMGTTATTITGGIKELVTKIGSTVIGTVGTTITSAIKAIQDKLVNYVYDATNETFRIYAGTALFRMSESESVLSAWFDDEHRITLGGPNNENEVGTIRSGDSYVTINDTNGFVELHSGASNAKHRLYICNGSNPSYAHAQMVLRCEDTYIHRPSDLSRLDLVAGDTAYISIGSNAGETAGRIYLMCPGGLIVNGYVGYTGTFKDQAGRTVTVKNGIINTIA